MSQVKVTGNASGTGTLTIAAPNTNSDYTLTLPAATGNILTSATTTGFPAGSVLQVVNFTDATYQSTTSTTFADTSLTLSITPSSASNKILVLITLNGIGKNTVTASGGAGSYRLVNGSNSLIANIFDGAGWTGVSEYNPGLGASFIYLDSPNTTSAYTYKVQYASEQSGQGATLNWYNDNAVTRSTITLMEIAA